MSKERAVFSFDLHESLYFEKGQEVAEMLSISLEPNISIQPFNEYVSIRGVIELQGDYKKSDELAEETDRLEAYETHNSLRYVEKISDMENGKLFFSHRFPVEISVPANRVSDLDDITVDVDAFDYELPSNGLLVLKSTIKINGINEDEEIGTMREETQNDQLEYEERKREEANTRSVEDRMNSSNDFVESPNFELDIKTNEQQAEKPVAEGEKDRFLFKQTESIQQFMKKDEQVNELKSTEELNKEIELHSELENSAETNLQIEAKESDAEEADLNAIDSLNYLSDMFRNEAEEQYSSMRLCIVQEEDTIETISKRYEVPALQIVNKNKLVDADLTPGQLLYIPSVNK
ncbi:stage VI sporulation protein D [Virgibacillus sp. W0430]|uniref:stage VI sporulation protein D n=1 Tax=Virgibacillus sp. W0430 TaxID=3391580 RepID=UPI003F45B9C2